MSNGSRDGMGAMIIIGVLFFIFGFISWLNAILIPYFKLACELSTNAAMLVAFAFYISYFVMAFPSSWILKKVGYKNGMIAGLLIMAAGALIFIPAAMTRVYSIFLLGLFIQGTGLTLLQTASNPYVTILGPIESAASRISIMGVCSKVAGAIAPLILIGVIMRNPAEIDQLQIQLPLLTPDGKNAALDELSRRLIVPYLVVAGVLTFLALMIRFTRLPDIKEEGFVSVELTGMAPEKTSVFQFKHLMLGAIAIFCGVSAEVLAVDTIINYAQYSGLAFEEAKYFASYTLIFMIISYCIGIFIIPLIISQRNILKLSAIVGIVFTLLALSFNGLVSIWFIALLGLGNALIWPSLWPLSLTGLGKFTGKGSALMIMGVVGGAISPLIYGAFSDQTNPQVAYWLLIPFYLFIFYFSAAGYKAGLPKPRPAFV
ncbi:sugar MFS transporter [Flavitalea sp.]|nr:sugar MFS transporter [Flavitalea sp.]